MVRTRQPRSKFEKFTEGLRVLGQFQPAAKLDAIGGILLVGDTTDENVPRAAREYLAGLGFFEDDQNFMFAFVGRKQDE
jgi:carbamoylphosphate synthase large subunit